MVVAPANAQTFITGPDLKAPFFPTPMPVVAEMLRVANVNANDVLYDLGSGDGRIVITAAQHFGARGVGIEIDPQLIRDANDNALKAGVADRVRFLRGDIFEADIREATIVTLYLLPDVNMMLRPKLLRELRPGTRVVSHNYDMGDWRPEKTITVTLSDGSHTIYYWVVPPRDSR
jgi:precorrin-6B methylase 2